MGRVIAGMTMSLDGFVADADGNVDRLYSDLAALQGTAYMNAAIQETGAVLMGRKTFEMADPDSYLGAYEFQVPIFVLTHHPPRIPPKQDERLTFTFVSNGVASAVAQAKAAAGDKAVQVVGGANVIQQLLRAGLVDELHVDIMPVLLGDGLRFLKNIDPDRVHLEKIGVEEVEARTTLTFRVIK
jgi:dihydrofolate reductase